MWKGWQEKGKRVFTLQLSLPSVCKVCIPPEEEAIASKACGNKYKYCKKIVCNVQSNRKRHKEISMCAMHSNNNTLKNVCLLWEKLRLRASTLVKMYVNIGFLNSSILWAGWPPVEKSTSRWWIWFSNLPTANSSLSFFCSFCITYLKSRFFALK